MIALALIAVVLFLFSERKELFPGYGLEVRIATVALLVILGWGLARSLGRWMGPALYRRLEPGTAGAIGFLVRLLTIGLVVVIALRIAGLKPGTLAVGGAFTAVILGLAAQQVLGNVLAGIVLLGSRPFRVGSGSGCGAADWPGRPTASSASSGSSTPPRGGADRILVPNGILLQCAVTPLREPERVRARARFDAGTSPRSEVQEARAANLGAPPVSAPYRRRGT